MHRFKKLADVGKVANATGDIVLENVVGVFTHREAPYAYVLERHGKKIGFEAHWYYLPNDDRGRQLLVLKIQKFGEDGDVSRKLGLRPVGFASAQERAEALVDAAEALLTLSNSHKKGRQREGSCAVELEGRIVRMEDFDIIEEDLGID